MPKADLSRGDAKRVRERGISPAGGVRPAYVAAPARTNVSSGYKSLADGLASFNPALRTMQASSDLQAKTAAEAEKARQTALAEKRLAGMTIEEANKAVADGTMSDYDKPHFKAAVDKIRGIRTAKAVALELEEGVASGQIDMTSTDMEALITEKSAATLQGASEHFTSGFSKTISGFRDNFMGKQVAAEIEELEATRAEGAHEVLREVAMSGTPEEAAQAIMQAKGEINQTLGVNFNDADALIVEIAEEIAMTGDVGRVEALLSGQRVDGKGVKVGSIAQKKDYGVKVQTLIQKAKNVRDSGKSETDWATLMEYDDRIASGEDVMKDARSDVRLTGAQQRQISEKSRSAQMRLQKEAEAEAVEIRKQQAQRQLTAGAMAMAQSGTLFMATDAEIQVGDGIVKMTAKEIKETGLNMAVDQAQRRIMAEYGGQPPAGVMESEIEKLVTNNATPFKPWKDLMSSASSIATLTNIGPEGEIPPQVSAAFDLYRNISRTTAEQHISNQESRDFLRAAYVAQKRMGMDTTQALHHAISVRESQITGQAGVSTQAIIKSVGKMDLNGIWPGGKAHNQYSGYARRDITEIASNLAASTGVAPDIALEEAVGIYKDTHTLVKGVAVKVPAGYSKGQFKKVAEDFISTWANRNDPAEAAGWLPGWNEDRQFEDLHLRSVDGGETFQMFNGLLPLGRTNTYTMANLERLAALRETEKQDGQRQQAVGKAQSLKKHRTFVDSVTKEPDPNAPSLQSIR